MPCRGKAFREGGRRESLTISILLVLWKHAARRFPGTVLPLCRYVFGDWRGAAAAHPANTPGSASAGVGGKRNSGGAGDSLFDAFAPSGKTETRRIGERPAGTPVLVVRRKHRRAQGIDGFFVRRVLHAQPGDFAGGACPSVEMMRPCGEATHGRMTKGDKMSEQNLQEVARQKQSDATRLPQIFTTTRKKPRCLRRRSQRRWAAEIRRRSRSSIRAKSFWTSARAGG